ncbi:hypothetical protein SUGI_0850710 [Cryptomeria japonica]|nr:hypothetical protein SUGI_0850710 [Cryptomeria japonica]
MALENCTQSMSSESFVESVQVLTTVLLVSSVILFIFLILRDGVKGLKIKAHWIPGDFLVLSALTIQLLNLISTQGQPLNWEQRNILLVEFWMIHTSRIMLCIVIAYLIPAMANPGAEDFWGKIISLALTVFLHVLSELYFINPKSTNDILKRLWPRQRGTSIRLYYIFAAIIFSSFVLLLLLLGCANIAGRGIERIVAKKIRLILKGQVKEDHRRHHHHSDDGVWRKDEDQQCWQELEDAVLRAWIIVRAYSLDYVIARSALASSAATIVTIQIAITLLAGVRNSPQLLICTPLDKLRFIITMMQCLFILIGWSMILWRWVTSMAYCRNGNWSSCFRVEDFWTRHLRELQEAKKNQLPQSQLLHAKIENLVVNQSTKITLHRCILYAVIGVQWFTVSFSKACWLGSRILFHNKLTGKLLYLTLPKLSSGFADYKGKLKGVEMLGETTESLWFSNRNSIRKAVALICRGEEVGERKCRHLVNFVATKRTGCGLGLSCLDPYKPQTGLKYLCKKSPIEGTEEEKFTDTSRKPWKMTAVSLLSIIVQLSPICAETEREHPSTSRFFPPKVVEDCLNAYSEAWEIIDFVDKADTEINSEAADEFTSEAADKYFSTLRTKGLFQVNNTGEATHPHNVTAALAELKKECKSKTEMPGPVKAFGLKSKEKTQGCPNRLTGDDSTHWKAAAWGSALYKAFGFKSKEKTPTEGFPKGWKGADSINWKAEAWGSAVYKLCNSIEYNEETDVNDLLKELESCLADIINECLEQFQNLVLLNCKKWALEGDERKIAKALYTTGKASKISMALLRGNIVMEERSGSAIDPHLV